MNFYSLFTDKMRIVKTFKIVNSARSVYFLDNSWEMEVLILSCPEYFEDIYAYIRRND